MSVVVGNADGYLTDAECAAAVDVVRGRVEDAGPGAPRVVVLPWGGYTHDGAGLPFVSAAVRALVALPAAPAVTAAAGNDSLIDRLTYPASLKDVVAVAATTGASPATGRLHQLRLVGGRERQWRASPGPVPRRRQGADH